MWGFNSLSTSILSCRRKIPGYASDPHPSMKSAAEELAIFVSGCPENCEAAIRSFNSNLVGLAAVDKLFQSCGDVMMQIDIAETLHHCLSISFDKTTETTETLSGVEESILCRYLEAQSTSNSNNKQESLAVRLKRAVVATNASLSDASTVASVEIDTLHFNVLPTTRGGGLSHGSHLSQDFESLISFKSHVIDFGLRSYVVTILDNSSPAAVPELVEISYNEVMEWKVSETGVEKITEIMGKEKQAKVTLVLNKIPDALREFQQVVERWGEVKHQEVGSGNCQVVMEMICDAGQLRKSMLSAPSVSAALHKSIKGFPEILPFVAEQSPDLPDWVVEKPHDTGPNKTGHLNAPSPPPSLTDLTSLTSPTTDTDTDWGNENDKNMAKDNPKPASPIKFAETGSKTLSGPKPKPNPKLKPKRLAGMRRTQEGMTKAATPVRLQALPKPPPHPRAKARKGRHLVTKTHEYEYEEAAPHAPTPAMNVTDTVAPRAPASTPQVDGRGGGVRRSSRSAAAAATRKLNATLCAPESSIDDDDDDDNVENEEAELAQEAQETRNDRRPLRPRQAAATQPPQNPLHANTLSTKPKECVPDERADVFPAPKPAPKPAPNIMQTLQTSHCLHHAEAVQPASRYTIEELKAPDAADPDFALYLSDEDEELSLNRLGGAGDAQGVNGRGLEDYDDHSFPSLLRFSDKKTPNLRQPTNVCPQGQQAQQGQGRQQEELGLLDAMCLIAGNDFTTPSPATSSTAGMYNNILSHLVRDQEKEARARYSANLASVKKWAKRQLAIAKRHTATEMEDLENQKVSRLRRVQAKMEENAAALLKLEQEYQQRLDILNTEKRCLVTESQSVTEEFDREMQRVTIQGKRKVQEAFGKAEAAIQEEKQDFERHISKTRRMHNIISTVLPLCS